MKKACVAFLNYKRHDLARAAVRQVYGDPFPVFVFDNGGNLTDPLDGAEVIHRQDNLLFTRGWNWAMEHLTHFEYVWMCNDDVQGYGQDMLGILVAALASSPADMAVVSPAFNSPHGAFHRTEDGRGLREVGWMDWTCPVMRMATWRNIGPFDPRFLGYGADLDWCKRARGVGWKFYVHDGLQVHHLGSQTALSQGLQGKQGNTAEMNRLLCEKWGVGHWTDLVGGVG